MFYHKAQKVRSAQQHSQGQDLEARPRPLGLCSLVETLHCWAKEPPSEAISTEYDSDFSPLHSYALRFLYEREASLDGVC